MKHSKIVTLIGLFASSILCNAAPALASSRCPQTYFGHPFSGVSSKNGVPFCNYKGEIAPDECYGEGNPDEWLGEYCQKTYNDEFGKIVLVLGIMPKSTKSHRCLKFFLGHPFVSVTSNLRHPVCNYAGTVGPDDCYGDGIGPDKWLGEYCVKTQNDEFGKITQLIPIEGDRN